VSGDEQGHAGVAPVRAGAVPHPEDREKWRGVVDEGRARSDFSALIGPSWHRVWRCYHFHDTEADALGCAMTSECEAATCARTVAHSPHGGGESS